MQYRMAYSIVLSSIVRMVSRNDFLRLPLINIYNSERISVPHKSIEHIIPKRLFKKNSHANHLSNLAFTDRNTNSLRRDFRLGDLHTVIRPSTIHKEHVFYDLLSDDYEPVYDGQHSFTGLLSASRRIFYPKENDHLGLVGRSIIDMLHRYPYLYDNLDEIVTHPGLLSKWNCYPATLFETERNALL